MRRLGWVMVAMLTLNTQSLFACRDIGGTPYQCLDGQHCDCSSGFGGGQPGWDGAAKSGRCVVLIGAPQGNDCGCDYAACGCGRPGSTYGNSYVYSACGNAGCLTWVFNWRCCPGEPTQGGYCCDTKLGQKCGPCNTGTYDCLGTCVDPGCANGTTCCTGSCQATCTTPQPPSSATLYRCSGGGGCIADNVNGTFTDSRCGGTCSTLPPPPAPPPTPPSPPPCTSGPSSICGHVTSGE